VAKYNLLETDDFMLRAMIAVGLGCDTLPKGVKGLGVGTISSVIEKQQITSADELAEFYEKKSNLPASLYKAFATATMFESANVLEVSESSSPIFVHGAPQSLPEYLKEFGVGTTIPTNNTAGCPNFYQHLVLGPKVLRLRQLLHHSILSSYQCECIISKIRPNNVLTR